ncbi:MAG TPA: hypothetical protein VKA19_07395, partial [Alphaproteobacteria bacterium]|nr:hypothetical protein [Alphaproteobacteria bacterium]
RASEAAYVAGRAARNLPKGSPAQLRALDITSVIQANMNDKKGKRLDLQDPDKPAAVEGFHFYSSGTPPFEQQQQQQYVPSQGPQTLWQMRHPSSQQQQDLRSGYQPQSYWNK